MNIHNVISYVHNFDLSDKFQVVFEAHGSSLFIYLFHYNLTECLIREYIYVM